MALVEGDGIAGHQPAHDFAERRRAGPHQGMEMVP